MDVQERWWHRLVKIALAGAVLLVAAGGLLLSINTWEEYRQRHSWDRDWDTSLVSKPCQITPYSEELGASVNCGGLYRPIELFDAMTKARVIQDYQEFRDASEYQQALAMAAALEKWPQRYWEGSVFSPQRVWTSLGWLLLACLIAAGLAYLVWRLLLYVAHGPKAKLIH